MKRGNLRKLLLLAALAGIMSACGTEKKEESAAPEKKVTGTIETVTQEQFDPEKVQVIDIRSEEQYIGWNTEEGNGGHIKNAVDFPESWLDMDIEKDAAIGTSLDAEMERRGLDVKKEVVLYGNDTVTEETAKKYQAAGFEKIGILEGGYNAYTESGKETESLKHYEMYVSPQWVQDLADGKNPETYNGNGYAIVEVSLASETEEYASGHLPGAINVSADDINHVPGPRQLADYEAIPLKEQLKFWNRPADKDIQSMLEELGITKDTTVILYGTTAATTAAARTGLIMKYAGVEDIRILNGGKTLWKLEGRELDKEEHKPEKAAFGTTVPANPDVIYDYDEELAVVNSKDGVVASIRSWPEYKGDVSGYTYIGEAGDIANSRFGYAGSDPYSMEDFRNVDNTMFNYEMMAARWEKWGITPDKEVSFHCGTGWRASETYFYAYAMGWEDIHVYDGGWYEWHKVADSSRKEEGLPEDAPEQEPQEFFTVKEK